MDLRRTKLIQELREAREELLNFNFATDTTDTATSRRIGVSRPYAVVDDWRTKWTPTFKRFNSLISTAGLITYDIGNEINGYSQEEDPEIFNEIRPGLVAIIDYGLSRLDQAYEVKPLLLEDYIKRVKDTKLAELLKEFNSAKDAAPNLAAIGFRTILCLIIQEKAKRVNPTSNTATRTDLAPQPMIDSARNDHILSPDEQRMVNSFVSTHRDIYDFVTHRPAVLIDKDEIDTMVDLLNKLLPSIIN